MSALADFQNSEVLSRKAKKKAINKIQTGKEIVQYVWMALSKSY